LFRISEIRSRGAVRR